jgi:nucleotide-binding universal stress UspA family protein
MFKKILLPIDGSEHSNRAVDAAIQLCKGKEQDCFITILHVNPFIHYWGGELVAVNVDIEERIREESNNLIKPVAEKILQAGIHCESSVVIGDDPAQEIYQKAKEEGFDLIVMGSRGLGTFSELVLGSVSHKVIQHSNCPVLIVK